MARMTIVPISHFMPLPLVAILSPKVQPTRMRSFVTLPFLAAALLIPVAVSAQQDLTGRATVIDGDTIEILGERIRLNGIDAPEARQRCLDAEGREYRCGATSANALADFLAASTPTRCEIIDRDRYGRHIGNCLRVDGQAIAAWLVSTGNALDWPRYSKGAFASYQNEARAKDAGMWAGSFVEPWEWRKGVR